MTAEDLGDLPPKWVTSGILMGQLSRKGSLCWKPSLPLIRCLSLLWPPFPSARRAPAG